MNLKRNIAELLDHYLYDGDLYNKIEITYNRFEKMDKQLCEYYPNNCKKTTCSKCEFMEENLLDLPKNILDDKKKIEKIADEIVVLLKLITKKRKKKH
jgi:hypothetical protein